MTTKPAPDPKPVPAPPGAVKLAVHNCHTDQREVHIWRLGADGSVEIGSLSHDYNDWGTCPTGAATLDVDLVDGHEYLVVAVDPDAVTCDGENDPMKLACRRGEYPVRGSSSGPAEHWKVH